MHLNDKNLKLETWNLKLKQGFTLIEVMIAMAILAVMSVLIFSSTTQTINSKEDTEKIDGINHSASLALGKISTDLQMAFLVSSPDFLGSAGTIKTVFIGKEDQMNFATFSHTRYFKDAKEADFCEIGYFVENSKEESGGRNLMRRESRTIDDKPEEGGVSDPMIEGIKEFHLEYFDPKKKEWFKTWDSSQLDFANRLPRAVKIEIKVDNPEGEEPFTYSTIAEIKLNVPINF
jgi:type II secretion system protein J